MKLLRQVVAALTLALVSTLSAADHSALAQSDPLRRGHALLIGAWRYTDTRWNSLDNIELELRTLRNGLAPHLRRFPFFLTQLMSSFGQVWILFCVAVVTLQMRAYLFITPGTALPTLAHCTTPTVVLSQVSMRQITKQIQRRFAHELYRWISSGKWSPTYKLVTYCLCSTLALAAMCSDHDLRKR